MKSSWKVPVKLGKQLTVSCIIFVLVGFVKAFLNFLIRNKNLWKYDSTKFKKIDTRYGGVAGYLKTFWSKFEYSELC